MNDDAQTARSTDRLFAVPTPSPRFLEPVRRSDRDAGPVSSARAGEVSRRWGRAAGEPALGKLETGANPRPRAKSVICLFQHGGPSQMDLFDPKPALTKHHGKPYPGTLEIHFDKKAGNLLASPFRFQPHGQSGMVVSELVPHLSRIVDDLTLVRSMTTESVDHESALRLIHTGKVLAGRPTWGSWVVYALGTEDQNLPAYVVLSDPGGLPVDGVRNWSSGWLPAIDQGTPFRSGDAPVLNLKTPPGITAKARRLPAPLSRRAESLALQSGIPATPSSKRGSPTSRPPPRCRRPSRRRSTSPGNPRRPGGCTASTTRPPGNMAPAA